jgi:DNA-binding MarR family transcriptional regulator
MDKQDVLQHLARVGRVDAIELAEAFGMPYPAAAMMLLRLLRQGLVARYRDDDPPLYWYELTANGLARLRYFQRRQGPRTGAIRHA